MRLNLRSSRETVTVNVEEKSLRLLTVKGGEVQKWGQAPLEPGWVENGLIRDPAQVGLALESLFREQEIPKKGRTITSLTVIGLGSTAHIFDLPKMKPSLLEGAINREAKRAMPVPVEELYLSHQVIGEKGDMQQVYVLGAPRDLVDAHITAFQMAGIQLRAMDLKPLALVRAVNQRNAVIADLENENFHVIVVRDAIPDITRSAVLHREGLDLQQKAHRLVEEVIRTIDFYNHSHPDKLLEPSVPVFLTGELTAIPSVNRTIQAEMGYTTEVPQPPLVCPKALPLSQFIVNIGLALRKEA
ncbi:MAG: type IV pilus biogenesis protein PilM [Anaerolineae bacterium]